MGAIGEAFGAFVQPLVDQTDGSLEQLNKAVQIGQLCYNLALLPPDEREKMLVDIRSSYYEMDDEQFDDFRRTVVAPMIRRHEQMFPRMHRRDRADEWDDDLPGGGAWIVRKPFDPQPAKTQRPVDRYAPCPCNSGKKYKFCCGMKPR